jgi:diacylglycerol kinase (ATP)
MRIRSCNFLKSFRFAFRGIVFCINKERNMRIHTVIALYVFVFSSFFHLSFTGYAVLFLTFAAVLMGEMLNTAVEYLSNAVSPAYNSAVRTVKDIAAGAVLVGAFFAVCVAVCLFREPEGFVRIGDFFRVRPGMVVLLAAVTAASAIYIALGPPGIRDFVKRRLAGRKKHHE